MCGKRYCLLLLLLLVFLPVISPQEVSVPFSVLESLRKEVSLIRRESNALKALLAISEQDSVTLRNRLAQVESKLSKAESLLAEASMNLEQSEAGLIPLQEDLAKLRNELAELKKQAEESNRRFLKLQKEKRFWMIAAISVTVVFTAVEIGRGLAK